VQQFLCAIHVIAMESQLPCEEAAPYMKTMGCETHTILPWALHLVERHGRFMRHPHALGQAARFLIQHVDQLKECPVNPTLSDAQKLLDSALGHLASACEAGIRGLPKHHFWCHLCKNVLKHGPPFVSATFLDESLNLAAAKAASGSHRLRWEENYFKRISLIGDLGVGQGRFFAGSFSSTD
jgi:hypothetical protein